MAVDWGAAKAVVMAVEATEEAMVAEGMEEAKGAVERVVGMEAAATAAATAAAGTAVGRAVAATVEVAEEAVAAAAAAAVAEVGAPSRRP